MTTAERARRKPGLTPHADPRAFADVLRDWMAQHDLTAYGAAKVLPATKQSIAGWLAGRPCPVERSHRALMTLIDEGRV